jgi:hypothetical protein
MAEVASCGHWERSFFSLFAPEWRMYWDNAYLRSAVSGLGIASPGANG